MYYGNLESHVTPLTTKSLLLHQRESRTHKVHFNLRTKNTSMYQGPCCSATESPIDEVLFTLRMCEIRVYSLYSVTGLAPWFIAGGSCDVFLFCVISINM